MDIRVCLDGGLVLKNNGNYRCLNAYQTYENVALVPSDQHYAPDPAIYGVTFGASFMLVGSFYAVGMGVRSVLRMLR